MDSRTKDSITILALLAMMTLLLLWRNTPTPPAIHLLEIRQDSIKRAAEDRDRFLVIQLDSLSSVLQRLEAGKATTGQEIRQLEQTLDSLSDARRTFLNQLK